MPDQVQLKNAAIEKSSHIEYFNIAVSVDCVIFGYQEKQLKVLLIKSDLQEFEGMWSLIGDLVKPNEDIEHASYRVLKQRTGLEDVYLEQVYTFGGVHRHPSGRVVTIAYYALVNVNCHRLKLADYHLHWYPVKELGEMAFDHKAILYTCLKRLQVRIMEEPIVFNLLPEKFSLRALQDVYEAILGTELDRRNFRKRINLKNWLVDLDQMEADVPHRPGKLYSLDRQLNNYGKKQIAPHTAVLPE
jgi:8-oxo-dGTP diphosphatase